MFICLYCYKQILLHTDYSSSENSSSEVEDTEEEERDEEEEEGLEGDEDVVKVISTAGNTSLGQWEEHTSVRMRNTTNSNDSFTFNL